MRNVVGSGRGARPNSAPGETDLIELRRSGVGLVGVGIRLTIIVAGASYLAGILPLWLDQSPELIAPMRWAIVLLMSLLILMMVIRRFSWWASSRAMVTTRRVTIRYQSRGASWDIPMLSIVDVSCRSGTFQRLFGTGSLIIRTNFSPQPAVVLDVSGVADVRDAIMELRTREWAEYQRATAANPYASQGHPNTGLRAAS